MILKCKVSKTANHLSKLLKDFIWMKTQSFIIPKQFRMFT